MIHRAERLDEILSNLLGRVGGITIFPIWPKSGYPAKRVIVKARVGSKAPIRISAGLVLHKDNGEFTKSASNILFRGKPIDI